MKHPVSASAVTALVLGLMLGAATLSPLAPAGRAGAITSSPSVTVHGNELVNSAGQVIRPIGVDLGGPEVECAHGSGIFRGPSDSSSVQAMANWYVNAVRIPLNEDCWLGINGVDGAYAGSNYQSAIENYVSLLNAHGMIVILALLWNAPGAQLADSTQDMADEDHSPAFWTSVATAFKSDPGVMFDLYNEPRDISWSCWLNGCTTPDGWQAAGMQQLVNTVRATGASQPLMVGGLDYANDLSGWLANRPTDPDGQLVASFHVYNNGSCVTTSCWNQTVASVAHQVPVVTGEIGEYDCADGFIDGYMNWADSQGIGYLAWEWGEGCTGPALLRYYNGTPSPFGVGYMTHVAGLNKGAGALSQVAGPDRIGTSIAWSQRSWGAGSANAVLLARDDLYPDALAGAPLAAELGGPLLLTEPTQLDPRTATELARVLPAGGTVYLLGGVDALSDDVAAAVTAQGYQVDRLAGPDRFGTAAAVAADIPSPAVVLLATGDDFPDALAAGAAAASMGGVVLLTDGSSMAPATSAWLAQDPKVPVYAIGGPAVVADPSAVAVAGADRYATAVAVAQQFFKTETGAVIASGVNFPDALSASPLAGVLDRPVLLTDPNALSAPTAGWLSSTDPPSVLIAGGDAAVSDTVQTQVASAISP